MSDAPVASPRCRLLVVKVAERCNLNCSYCYMYNGGDQSYLKRPGLMSLVVVEAMMRRVRAHCLRHGITEFAFVLHGGEPMLAKPRFYRQFVAIARDVLADAVRPIFAMQTNGTLIDDEWCRVLLELGIRVSFSLDGPQVVNDRFRLDKKGRGTFTSVMHGWHTAKTNGLDPGLLMVVDVGSDPNEVYDLIRTMSPRTVDFLFPDATYEKPPPGYRVQDSSRTPYADWLLTIFDRWYEEGRTQAVPDIRLFLQIIRGLLGKSDGYDVLGSGKIEVLVVESDGEIQPLDGLRFCEDGIADTDLSILTHELDDAYGNELIRLYHGAHDNLAAECRSCKLRGPCGGGFLPHRYKKSNGFDNPSLYCADFYKLIASVQGKVLHDFGLGTNEHVPS